MKTPIDRTLSHVEGRPRRAGERSPRPFFYRVLSSDTPLLPPSRHALGELETVVIGRGEIDAARSGTGAQRTLGLRVPDRWMSSSHAQLQKVLGRWVLEDQHSKNGTLVNGAPATRAMLSDGDLIECGHTFFVYRDAVPAMPDEPPDFDGASLSPAAPGLGTMVPPLARELSILVEVARSPVSVLIGGESGTGKELVARAVHRLSGRPGEFVAVNCGALPDTLIESELFGSKKGAYSGASEDRPGLVRASDRGTLFLDEIGDLPAASQAAFLRVLQEREVVAVGATRPVKVDLRLVAATHRNLNTLVAAGRFRADLLARLAGFSITLPPLRERREDLGLLLGALLLRAAQGLSSVDAAAITLGSEAARALFLHPFRLNVRELEKCLATALVLARAGARGGEIVIERSHLQLETAQPEALSHDHAPDPDEDDGRPLSDEDEKRCAELVNALREHAGNISAAARAMGKARMQVQRWIKRFGIDVDALKQ